MKVIRLIVPLLLCCAPALRAAEYIVDSAGGSLTTIAAGLKLLQPGDTLTIMPGEYHEALTWEFDGDAERTTTVRAAVPGTVVLRGDLDAPAFTAHSARVWSCPWKARPQAVNERDTLTFYRQLPTLEELDFQPGAWFYDEEAGRLYVHTGDSRPPDRHYLTVSMLSAHGLFVKPRQAEKVQNIVIDGLIFTGYNNHTRFYEVGVNTRWGLYVYRGANCVIRNCVAFMNGGGLGTWYSENCLVEFCRAYGNFSPHMSSAGNIVMLTPAVNTKVRHCIAFDSQVNGIRFYGRKPAENCLVEFCVAFNNLSSDIGLKGPSDSSFVRGCVAEGAIQSRQIDNCLFNGHTFDYSTPRQSISTRKEKNFRPDLEFADPINHDYRLQSGSAFRGRAPLPESSEVFFVSPGGNDRADGRSLKTAWRTLARIPAGGTVYLSAGNYPGGTFADLKNVTLRGRGNDRVVLSGDTVFSGRNLTLERLNFLGEISVSGSDIAIEQCGFNRKLSVRTDKLKFAHNALNAEADFSAATGAVITANIFNREPRLPESAIALYNLTGADFTDPGKGIFTVGNPAVFNGWAASGMPVGPFRRQAIDTPLSPDGPRVLSVTATTANLEWQSNLASTFTLEWDGGDAIANHSPEHFQTVSLNGLEPGRKYRFRVSLSATVGEHYSNAEPQSRERRLVSDYLEFTTSGKDVPPTTYHVSTVGNDQNSGLSPEEAWRSISLAATRAKAGDTVLVHEGVYYETVRLRAGGDRERPLTITGVPGKRIELNGKNQLLPRGFIVNRKSHVVIDHFYLHDFGPGGDGVKASDSSDLTLSRIFYDGRSANYTPNFLTAERVANLTISNCLVTRSFTSMKLTNCPDLRITNCVFYINQIADCFLYNRPHEKALIANNIVVDNIPLKTANVLFRLGDAAPVTERDNCYFLRVPRDQKPLWGFDSINSKPVPENQDAHPAFLDVWSGGRMTRQMATYDEFMRQTGQTPTSIFIDPQFPVLSGFIQFKDAADWKANWPAHDKSHQKNELKLIDGKYEKLHFSDFISRNPELRKRGIGLKPEAFGSESGLIPQ